MTGIERQRMEATPNGAGRVSPGPPREGRVPYLDLPAIYFNPAFLRIFRILGLEEVLHSKYILVLLGTVRRTIAQIASMALEFIYFFFALFFFYAVMGMELFAQLGCPPSSFKNFGSSFFTLCEVFTGNNWIKILTDIKGIGRPGDACSPYLAWVAPLYFISFVTCAWFLLLTVIGIVLAISELALQDSLQEYRQWSSPSVEGTEAVSPTTATD